MGRGRALRGGAGGARGESVIRPALERGADVVCDRYVDSSLAYQGIARGLGVDRVLELNLAVVGGLLPDRTFLLLVDPADALRPRRGADPDRIEREDGSTSSAASTEATASSPSAFPQRIAVVDGVAARRRDRDASSVDSVRATCLSRRRRSASSARRSRSGRRTRTSSTGRRGVGKRAGGAGVRRASCSATRRASSGARIPTCTCSSRSATRSGSTRSASCGATCTCGRSRRRTGASTSSSAPTG